MCCEVENGEDENSILCKCTIHETYSDQEVLVSTHFHHGPIPLESATRSRNCVGCYVMIVECEGVACLPFPA